MQTFRLGKDRQQRFLAILAKTGDEVLAAIAAGTDCVRVRELRENDQAFAAQWEEARETGAGALEYEARRRAIEGFAEPIVSDGKVVRDDDGRPVASRRYSDALLIALLKAQDPEKFGEYAGVGHAIYPAWLRRMAVVVVTAFLIWALTDLGIRLMQFTLLPRYR